MLDVPCDARRVIPTKDPDLALIDGHDLDALADRLELELDEANDARTIAALRAQRQAIADERARRRDDETRAATLTRARSRRDRDQRADAEETVRRGWYDDLTRAAADREALCPRVDAALAALVETVGAYVAAVGCQDRSYKLLFPNDDFAVAYGLEQVAEYVKHRLAEVLGVRFDRSGNQRIIEGRPYVDVDGWGHGVRAYEAGRFAVEIEAERVAARVASAVPDVGERS